DIVGQERCPERRAIEEEQMTWDGQERRTGNERRLVERRHTMRYNVRRLVVVDGITWIDPEDGERRMHIRRRRDREALAIKVARHAAP
ncbi:MAG TPA: hypothetical protein VLE20_13025, partial [Blastocatellia bacterium]|nr:hypothetical protein [Blastocatellia bacterium]